jgi:CRP-like cAMP-binding protein
MSNKGLQAQEVFSFLRSDQVNAISEAAEVVDLQAGDTVYYRGARADQTFVVLQGEVSLRLPGKGGLTVPIDRATAGDLFGSCVCMDMDRYTTTAQCTQDSRLLRIDAMTLRDLMDNDLPMGYAIQRRISRVYFRRYMETMRKLQGMVMNIPLEQDVA